MMFIFQYASKQPSAKSEMTPTEASRLLVKKDGYVEIANLMKTNPAHLKFIIQNRNFHMALREPDKMPAEWQKNLVENMTRLGDDPKFITFLTNAMTEPAEGLLLRRLVGDLYNSNSGKKALDGMEHIMRSLGNTAYSLFLPTPHIIDIDVPFGIAIMLESYRKVPDEYLRMNYEYFKYPEKEIHVKDLGAKHQKAFAALQDYAKTGDKAKSKEFLEFSGASDIFRTQELRKFLLDVLIDRPKEEAERLALVLFSSKGRAIVEKAAETPEGINTIGYLWNSSGVNRFFDVLGKNLIGGVKTILMIMEAQSNYRKKNGPGYQNCEAWKKNENNALRASPEVAAALEKARQQIQAERAWDESFTAKLGMRDHAQTLASLFGGEISPQAADEMYRTCLAYASKNGWIKASSLKNGKLDDDESRILRTISTVWYGRGGPKAISFMDGLKGSSAEEIIGMASKEDGEKYSKLVSLLGLKTDSSKRFWESTFSDMVK